MQLDARDTYSITVVIHPGSGCALTAHSMSCMTSLSQTLSVHLVSNSGFTFPFIQNRQDNIKFVGHLST